MIRIMVVAMAVHLSIASTVASADYTAYPQGIRGRAAMAGVLVENVTVAAYPYRNGSFGRLTGVEPIATGTSSVDGVYEIPLPPGRYVVEGLIKGEGNNGKNPETGDLQCLYSGSPVTVTPNGWTPVGLNLAKVGAETRSASERPMVTGKITFDGELSPRTYLSIYSTVEKAFRGPASRLSPVAKGIFRVALPPGEYYLVARKRKRGGAYGPMDIGDLFNFYPGNPVKLGAGEAVDVEIPLIERLSQLEEDPMGFQGLSVKVVDGAGKPVKGLSVLAYSSRERSGVPLSTSLPTDEQGITRLNIMASEVIYLRARKSLGGPLGDGEVHGDGEIAVGYEGVTVIKVSR